MRKIGTRIANPLFALLFAASLTFGVTSVFAQANMKECLYDPITFLGACTTEEECDRRCLAEGGFDGDCAPNPPGTTGCCLCAY